MSDKFPSCPFCGQKNFRIEGSEKKPILRCITYNCPIKNLPFKMSDWKVRPIESDLSSDIKNLEYRYEWVLPLEQLPDPEVQYQHVSIDVMVYAYNKIYAPAYIVLGNYKDQRGINRKHQWFFDNEYHPFHVVDRWMKNPSLKKLEEKHGKRLQPSKR